jgi:hypothetical protein
VEPATREPQPFAALRAAWEYEPPKPYRRADRVFELSGVVDPRFGPLELKDEQRIVHALLGRPATTAADLAAIRRSWMAPRVQRWCAEWNDAPPLGSAPTYALSDRAVDALRDLLEPDAVLLPLGPRARRYFVFIARVLPKALDTKQTHTALRHMVDGHRVWHIDRYGFRLDQTEPVAAFRVPQNPYVTFVTDRLVQRVKERRLNGFVFEIAFPLKASDTKAEVAWRTECRHAREGLPRGKTVEGQRIAVRFLLDNPDRAPTERQERQIKAWAKWVNDRLFDPTDLSPAIGSEHMTSPETGEMVSIFAGPDADALIARIKPLIADARWPGRIRIGRWRLRG